MRFNDQNFAMEYNARLEKEGYPGALFSHVVDGLAGAGEVLDVGAGTGFFTIPLAREGKKVIAVEPSAEMIRLMRAKITPDIAPRISVVQCDWENWAGAFCESLICIHSLYPMKDPEKALTLMKQRADICLVIVRTHEGRKTLSDSIRKCLIPGYDSPDHTSIIRKHLKSTGISWKERLIEETKTVVIDDIEREALFHSMQLFKDRSHAAQIMKIIEESSEPAGNGLVFTAQHRDILFTF